MKIRNIYLGSWSPKTLMHLKEFENFLRGKDIIDGLGMEKAAQLYINLDPSRVETHLNTDGIKYVRGNVYDSEVTYFSDGLLILKRPVQKLEDDIKFAFDIYHKILNPVLSFLFSRGARGLEIISEIHQKQPVLFHCEARRERELHDFFIKQGVEISSIHTHDDCTVYYADNIIVIHTKPKSRLQVDRMVEYLLLFYEVKRYSHRLLETHRDIWDNTEKSISEGKIKVKDLPRYSEMLTEYSNSADNIIARIDQMRLNFNFRVEKAKKNTDFFPRLEFNFESIGQNLDYLRNLFTMTRQHLQNSISQISNIYQENQENALNKLQILFLLSAVSAFMALGSYIPQDPSVPVQVENNFIGFSYTMLFRYGSICIILTAIVYYLWNYTFKNVKAKLKK